MIRRSCLTLLVFCFWGCQDGATTPETEHSGPLQAPMLALVSGGSPIIFDQGPSKGTEGNCRANLPSQNWAERFSFTEDMLITDIHIFTCVAPRSGDVRIKILGDDSGNPSPFVYTETTTPVGWEDVGPTPDELWKVTALLSTPFPANAFPARWSAG